MKKNVILITIDCLRADHLSCYGYARKTSPFIDFLSAKGMKFENAFANGPITSAAFLAIFASAYPLEFKNWAGFLPPNAILISQVLQEEGIRTAAIHSNPCLSAFYGYNQGWHYFQDFLPSNPKGRQRVKIITRQFLPSNPKGKNYLPKTVLELYLRARKFFGFIESYEDAETVTKCAISWLNRNKDHNFFLWIHYMDLHYPYFVFNAKFDRKYSKNISRLSQVSIDRSIEQNMIGPKSIRGIIDIYDDKLSYVDENIKELFHFLDHEGLIDHTLLVLTSDHGEEFLDHGCLGHSSRFYDELLHIPLILFGPEIKSQVNRSLVSQLDIAPTILNFYDMTPLKDYRGHNLLSTPTNRFIISEAPWVPSRAGPILAIPTIRFYAIRTEKWKYIHGGKQGELYNLEKDPKETKNVIDEEEVKAKELEAIIEEHISWEEKEWIRRKIKKLKILSKI